jgi:hypothetical protein
MCLLPQPLRCRTSTVQACKLIYLHFTIQQAYANNHRGLAEHSHRSELATNIVNEMKADLASFLDIPDSYEVLIMQGAFIFEYFFLYGLTHLRWRIWPVCCNSVQYDIRMDREAKTKDPEGARSWSRREGSW